MASAPEKKIEKIFRHSPANLKLVFPRFFRGDVQKKKETCSFAEILVFQNTQCPAKDQERHGVYFDKKISAAKTK